MSYPALDSFSDDIEIGYARWRVYMYLKPPQLSFSEAREQKVAAIQHALHMSPNTVIDALDWLTERGYLVEHGRDARGVRRLTLAWAIGHQPRTA